MQIYIFFKFQTFLIYNIKEICAMIFFLFLFVQNDLLTLKVTSQLHHLSIKCAIHVLHANKFNPNCLRRRPGEEVIVNCARV